MTAPSPNAAPSTDQGSSRSVGVVVALSWAVPMGIFLQALLAGQALFVSPSLFGLHGGIGHGVLLLALVATALLWRLRLSRTAAVLAALTFVGLIGQTGLGYAGRRSGIAAASSLHVPFGVALLGVSVAVAVLVTIRASDASAAGGTKHPTPGDAGTAGR